MTQLQTPLCVFAQNQNSQERSLGGLGLGSGVSLVVKGWGLFLGEVPAAPLEEQVEGGAVLLWQVSGTSMTK